MSYLFSSESVSEGHPDKVADQISDAILDACLDQDPDSHVALETLCTTDFIALAGEISTLANVNWEQVARGVVRDIGYTDPEIGFSADTAEVLVKIHAQSPDIAMGVSAAENKAQGAGDQGMMFGYACTETDALMPAPIYYAHRIVAELARLRKTEPEKYAFLRPDAKSQVSVRYLNGKPAAIETVVVSTQHTPDATRAQLESLVRKVVADVIPAEFLSEKTIYHVNPTGNFVIGGPAGDTGLTGRKIIVDTYGGRGLHGGGAFSGKDPSKVDRSAAVCHEHGNFLSDGKIHPAGEQSLFARSGGSVGLDRILSDQGSAAGREQPTGGSDHGAENEKYRLMAEKPLHRKSGFSCAGPAVQAELHAVLPGMEPIYRHDALSVCDPVEAVGCRRSAEIHAAAGFQDH